MAETKLLPRVLDAGAGNSPGSLTKETAMFDWMLSRKHAISILKKDHDTVKALFDKFEKTENRAARNKIIAKAVSELKAHAVIEEEIFYPAVRAKVGAKIMNEADEEHHVAKVLIAELDGRMKDEGHRDAKFTVLAESIRHHIQEEENEMLPKAKNLDIDFEALGETMRARKEELLTEGFPPDAEHRMVAKSAGRNDSPAAAARKKKSAGTRKASVKTVVAHGAKGKRRPHAAH